MPETPYFDPESPGDCAALFASIREVYPHLNDGLLESAMAAARRAPDGKRSRVHWALMLARTAIEAFPVHVTAATKELENCS